MPLVCLHCSLRAILNDQPPPDFGDQEPDEHMRLYHPDLDATRREREDLERRLALKFATPPNGHH